MARPLRSFSVRLLLLLGLLGCALATTAAALPPVTDNWIELRTESFRLISNTNAGKTAEIGLALERFRQALGRLKPGLRLTTPIPTRIVVFDSDRSFAPYKHQMGDAQEDMVGYFLSHPRGNFMALNGYPERYDALPVIYHEYVHFFVRHNLPHLPLWANEGLAEYYSTFRVDGDGVRLGETIERHVRYLREHSFLPFDRLFAVGPESPEYNEKSKVGGFYAQSWLMIHYLLAGPEDRQRGAAELLRLLTAGKPPEAAVRQALGFGLVELESKLRGYVNGNRFPSFVLRGTDLAAPRAPQVRSLSREEALCQLGDLLLAESDRGAGASDPAGIAAAEAHFQAATRVNADFPESYAGLAGVAWSRGQAGVAEGLAEKAIRLGSRQAETRVLLADILLDRLRKANETTPSAASQAAAQRALDRLAEALVIEPQFGEAEVLSGLCYFFLPDPVDPGVAHLERARALLPERADVIYNLAMLAIKGRRLDRAADLVEGDLAATGRAELLRSARVTLEQARENARANQAIARTNQQIDRFNQAVEKANAGEVRVALAELERLLPEVTDEDLRSQVADLIHQLEHVAR